MTRRYSRSRFVTSTADVLEFEFVIPNANYELSNLVFNGSGQGAELDQVANAAGLFLSLIHI